MPLLFTRWIGFQIIYLSMNASDQGQVTSFIHAYIEGRKMIRFVHPYFVFSAYIIFFHLYSWCRLRFLPNWQFTSKCPKHAAKNTQSLYSWAFNCRAPLNKIKNHILTNLNVWPTYIVILLITNENLLFKWGMIFVRFVKSTVPFYYYLSMCLSVWLFFLIRNLSWFVFQVTIYP